MSAVRQFYDKLIQLPLDEIAPSLYSHYLITTSTSERLGKPCFVRVEKNGFILQDVIAAVQQKPDLLDDFCNILKDMYIAAELAQIIKGIHFQKLYFTVPKVAMKCKGFGSNVVLCIHAYMLPSGLGLAVVLRKRLSSVVLRGN